jgi:hypothetical protein
VNTTRAKDASVKVYPGDPSAVPEFIVRNL